MSAWLTRVTLNIRHPAVRHDLTDAVGMHKRVMALLPDELGENPRYQAGVLYRVDAAAEEVTLLVQSTIPTDPTRLPDGYGVTATRDITALLDKLHNGMTVHYRIAANPTKRAWKGENAKKIVVLSGAEADAWWQRKAAAHGLALQSLNTQPQPTARTAASKMRHGIARFDGRATIADVDQTRQAVLGGIGRGRSYGCGLLSLAPAR